MDRAEPSARAVRGIPAERELRPGERVVLIAEILLAYARARRALRRAPIATAIAALRGGAPDTSSRAEGVEALDEIRRLGRAVSRTLALLPGDTRCLAQSLVLTRMLAERGIPARLVIGARAGPDFLAHAWVECGGHPVLTPGDGSFARLVEL
jgi:hypothetical protein